MVTVKYMMQLLDELKMKKHVWQAIKEHLEAFLPEGEVGAQLKIDGVDIPESIVIDVLGDIDHGCLEPIREKILRIEGAKVDESQKKERAKAPQPNPAQNTGAKKGVRRGPGRPRKKAPEDEGEVNGGKSHPG